MGGAAHEFHRVMRGDGPVWSGLLRLTATKASIDVISGTSAGGLNGALLAMAIARDSTIGRLRELWLKLGSLQSLLRPAGEADLPSLLQGDEYFLKHIAAALKELQSGKTSPEAARAPDDHDHASARSRAVSRITSARSSRTPTIVASSRSGVACA